MLKQLREVLGYIHEADWPTIIGRVKYMVALPSEVSEVSDEINDLFMDKLKDENAELRDEKRVLMEALRVALKSR